MSLYLKSLERSLEQEINAWRRLRGAPQLGPSYQQHRIPSLPLHMPVCVSTQTEEDIENAASALSPNNIRFVAALIAEKTWSIIVERAIGGSVIQRQSKLGRKQLERMQQKISATMDTIALNLERRVDAALCSFEDRLQVLGKRVRHAQGLHRASVVPNTTAERRHSMPTIPSSEINSQPLEISKASLGMIVWVQGVACWGTIRFYGKVPSKQGEWVGVALSLPRGKHNGEGLFPCKKNHGIFCRPQQLRAFPKSGDPRERRRRSRLSLLSSYSMRRTLAKLVEKDQNDILGSHRKAMPNV